MFDFCRVKKKNFSFAPRKMAPPKSLNKQSLNLIKGSEGFKPCVYKDPIGLPTIGYGHLIKPGDGFTPSTCITRNAAIDLLKVDVSSASQCIDRNVKVPLNPNEHGALTSWAYNVGCKNVESSTLIKELNSGNKNAVSTELNKWTKAGGKELPGLINRRQEECKLFQLPPK